MRRRRHHRPVTVRTDRVGDASRLYQLAALVRRTLAPGPFVVAEIDGRVVAAAPVHGGPVVSDPRAETTGARSLVEAVARQRRSRTLDAWPQT